MFTVYRQIERDGEWLESCQTITRKQAIDFIMSYRRLGSNQTKFRIVRG